MTMNILDFTAEEQSLIAIYAEPTRLTTAAAIVGAMPDMDKAFSDTATSSAAKLADMTDDEFEVVIFALADEDEPDDVA
jgi:hypothetical protein